jgi:glycosyltransferase involved in cell wall biosynthesis
MLPVEDTLINRAKAPMRLLDLLAAGVPTAVQDVGEYSVYVRDRETGLVAPAGDDLALADAVVRLLQDPRLGCQLGRAAQQVIDHHYSWQRLVHQALDAYAAAMAA